MPVDPTQTRQVLVVHGVQITSEDQLDQDRLIDELIRNRMGSIPLRFSSFWSGTLWVKCLAVRPSTS